VGTIEVMILTDMHFFPQYFIIQKNCLKTRGVHQVSICRIQSTDSTIFCQTLSFWKQNPSRSERCEEKQRQHRPAV